MNSEGSVVYYNSKKRAIVLSSFVWEVEHKNMLIKFFCLLKKASRNEQLPSFIYLGTQNSATIFFLFSNYLSHFYTIATIL
jgi:hypothetical protein